MRDPRKRQFLRGVKFANTPGGKAEFAVVDTGVGLRVRHVNTTMNVLQSPSDQPSLSGVIRYRRSVVPAAVSIREGRNTDRFGNVIFEGVVAV